MAKEDYYYLFGEEAVRAYNNGGLDELIVYIKNGGIFSTYHYDVLNNTPNDLLYEYNGFNDYTELDKLEYELIYKII
jgi:hypothetical protein